MQFLNPSFVSLLGVMLQLAVATNAAATPLIGSNDHLEARGAGLEERAYCTWPYTPRKEWYFESVFCG